MKKDLKLYRVTFGFLDAESGDIGNMRSSTVIAHDAPEAIKKTRLSKHEYVESVELLHRVDVP